jgi:hypothetical protein
MRLISYRFTEKGRHKDKLNLRFDFFAPDCSPVWISFSPQKVQFPRHCVQPGPALHKLLDFNVFIHSSEEDYFSEAESGYIMVDIWEFCRTDMLIEWHAGLDKKALEANQ